MCFGSWISQWFLKHDIKKHKQPKENKFDFIKIKFLSQCACSHSTWKVELRRSILQSWPWPQEILFQEVEKNRMGENICKSHF